MNREAPTTSAGVDASVDERFRGLLEGLRTSLPGVQVLVAFLLTLPLQASFGELGGAERVTYFVAFGAGLASSIFLIAPSVHQRVRAPMTGVERRSEAHLLIAVRLSIVGTVCMAVAFTASAVLVSIIVVGTTLALVVGSVFAGLMTWFWFLQPISWRHARTDDEAGTDG